MSTNTNMEWSELPIELRKQLKAVNLHSVESVQKRLAERRTAQILSYLQLTMLRLSNAPTLNTRHMQRIQDADDMAQYVELLHNRNNFLRVVGD